ncbi:hypothetical protein JCM19379_12400 [Methyloparacoccus murrellii]
MRGVVPAALRQQGQQVVLGERFHGGTDIGDGKHGALLAGKGWSGLVPVTLHLRPDCTFPQPGQGRTPPRACRGAAEAAIDARFARQPRKAIRMRDIGRQLPARIARFPDRQTEQHP